MQVLQTFVLLNSYSIFYSNSEALILKDNKVLERQTEEEELETKNMSMKLSSTLHIFESIAVSGLLQEYFFSKAWNIQLSSHWSQQQNTGEREDWSPNEFIT